VRIVSVWVAEWSAALPYACDSRRRGDLTPVIPGLSSWADARTWVMLQGVSSAPMGERRWRLASGESETDNAASGAQARR
jgi:hypothetical protein